MSAEQQQQHSNNKKIVIVNCSNKFANKDIEKLLQSLSPESKLYFEKHFIKEELIPSLIEQEHQIEEVIEEEENEYTKKLKSLCGIYFTIDEFGSNHGEEHPKVMIQKGIHHATKSIDIIMYQLTDKDIINQLIKVRDNVTKINKDFKLRIILDELILDSMDKKNNTSLLLFKYLSKNSELKIGKGNKNIWNTEGLIHHKIMIIDKILLLKGSYNYTQKAALLNYEDLEISLPNEEVMKKWNKRFEFIWNRL